MSSSSLHPEPERLEARAAGELAPREAEALDAHLARCARCRSEVEGWTTLFSELEGLPQGAPSADFGSRVMARVDVEAIRRSAAPLPLRSRLLEGAGDRVHAALRRLRGRRDARGQRHVTAIGMQDFLDGALAMRTRTRVEAHLATCRSCTEDLQRWSDLFHAMDDLPHLAPRPGFADRVMERVPVEAVAAASAPPPRSTGVLGAAGECLRAPAAWVTDLATRGGANLLPSTRRGWVLATALMSAPGVGVVALLAAIFLNPLLTMGDLLTFASWRAMDAGGALASSVLSMVGNAPGFPFLREVVLGVQTGPALAGATALTATVVLISSYVVYRNLIAPLLAPSSTGEAHVQPTS